MRQKVVMDVSSVRQTVISCGRSDSQSPATAHPGIKPMEIRKPVNLTPAATSRSSVTLAETRDVNSRASHRANTPVVARNALFHSNAAWMQDDSLRRIER